MLPDFKNISSYRESIQFIFLNVESLERSSSPVAPDSLNVSHESALSAPVMTSWTPPSSWIVVGHRDRCGGDPVDVDRKHLVGIGRLSHARRGPEVLCHKQSSTMTRPTIVILYIM